MICPECNLEMIQNGDADGSAYYECDNHHFVDINDEEEENEEE